MKPTEINDNEYKEYYGRYIRKAPDVGLTEGFERGGVETLSFLESIDEARYEYAYDEGKWTIKEVIQHLIDTERIFSFRAFHFARNDKATLPGYEQDDYAAESDANSKSKKELLSEYKVLRKATISQFSSFSDKMLKNQGILHESPMSCRAAGFIIVGHEVYHRGILEERYL